VRIVEVENTGIVAERLSNSLCKWSGLSGATWNLINHTENATFLISLANGSKKVLRVHRAGYNTPLAVQSELIWSKALRNDTGMFTPIAIAGVNGELVQHECLGENAESQMMVLFEFEEGREPAETEKLEASFIQLGKLAASAHEHTQNWQQPEQFDRLHWTANSILKPQGLWGDWRQAPGMSDEIRPVFDHLDLVLRLRLQDFGFDKSRYGLIHADMRLANLLVHDGQVKLIDFDDCGFCWNMYDFAAAISFMEDSPKIPTLKKAWLKGYRSFRELSKVDEAEMDTFVMLRRMALTAWIGSHRETPFAKSLAGDFVSRGAALAEQYLSEFG